jgi:hypothetical protein
MKVFLFFVFLCVVTKRIWWLSKKVSAFLYDLVQNIQNVEGRKYRSEMQQTGKFICDHKLALSMFWRENVLVKVHEIPNNQSHYIRHTASF